MVSVLSALLAGGSLFFAAWSLIFPVEHAPGPFKDAGAVEPVGQAWK